jgi:hypothetical protein
MNTFLPIAAILGFGFLFALVVGGIGSVLARRRREAFRQAALRHGFEFIAAPARDLLDSISQFAAFSKGRDRKISNLLVLRQQGASLQVFEYEYWTGARRSAHPSRCWIILWTSERLSLPRFRLTFAGGFHESLGTSGLEYVDVRDSPEFSRRYLLQGSSPERVRIAFHQALRQYFVQNPHLAVEGDAKQLLVVCNPINPAELGFVQQKALELLRQFEFAPR